jgi:hypothetical protein
VSAARQQIPEDLMPQLQPMSSSEEKPVVVAKADMPVCPACRHVMTVRTFTPSTSMAGVGDTVYACDTCGAETHRIAKRE